MSQLPADRMIPLLPCRSIDDQLAFYEALGFDASDMLRVQAYILRADAAHALGDDARARSLLDDAASIDLGDADQARIADDLTRAEELRSSLD